MERFGVNLLIIPRTDVTPKITNANNLSILANVFLYKNKLRQNLS